MDNKLRIVNHLGKHPGETFTMNQLSNLLDIPYATFYRTIQTMDAIINTCPVGKSKTITLNIGNPVMKSYLAISSEEEKRAFLKRQPILNKLASELKTDDIVVLFGSYAKNTAREQSDIDLLIINRKGNKSLSFSKYELLFKKKINPIFITREEFKSMLTDKEENVGKQALKDNIILQNPEGFWECVLHG